MMNLINLKRIALTVHFSLYSCFFNQVEQKCSPNSSKESGFVSDLPISNYCRLFYFHS